MAVTSRTLVLLSGVLTLTGCVMMKPHYRSMQQLRKEATINYSQQVLDTIVDMRDQARIPILFSVEAGNSTWTPNYSLSTSVFAPLYGLAGVGRAPQVGSGLVSIGESSLTSTVAGGEAMTNQLQYNDFGAAAMTRAHELYSLVCFPIQYGEVVLPNGVLFTLVDVADTRENMLFWAKTRDGRYLGVTPDKTEQFVAFAHDVTYWVQHAAPQASDLRSTAGSLFSFSIAYATTEEALIKAVLAKLGSQEAVAKAQKDLQAKQQKFEDLKAEAKESKTNPAVLQTLLTFEREELQAQQKAVANSAAQLGKAQTDIAANQQELVTLLASMKETLTLIERDDPDLEDLHIDVLSKMLHDRIDTILSEDRTKITALEAHPLPHAAGLTAEESADELYRERFESLPQQFPQSFQATQ